MPLPARRGKAVWKDCILCLEKHTPVRYNNNYEMNKKGRAERVAALSAPMQEGKLQHNMKYHAPIPILLDFFLFSNKEVSDLGPCVVLCGGVGQFPAPSFYLSRQCNKPLGSRKPLLPRG